MPGSFIGHNILHSSKYKWLISLLQFDIHSVVICKLYTVIKDKTNARLNRKDVRKNKKRDKKLEYDYYGNQITKLQSLSNISPSESSSLSTQSFSFK